MIDEPPKKTWSRLGNVDYIKIEIRPPKNNAPGDKRCHFTSEGCPPGSLGAYDAWLAVILADLRLEERPEKEQEFYAALKAFADGWGQVQQLDAPAKAATWLPSHRHPRQDHHGDGPCLACEPEWSESTGEKR